MSQFAYRDGGNRTNALLSIQPRILSNIIDDPSCKAVRLFSMDFSKAFDSVKHALLAEKLKMINLNPYILNWYIHVCFLIGRQHRVVYLEVVGDWRKVNEGMTQGSVSGPCMYLFNVLLNDLNIHLKLKDIRIIFKYADNTNIVIPIWEDKADQSVAVIDTFLHWTDKNSMTCNSKKCKSSPSVKKALLMSSQRYTIFHNARSFKFFGIIFQQNCKFASHVYKKRVKVNKCLHVVRTLRHRGYNQNEVDYLFQTIVMPNFLYSLLAYEMSPAVLNDVQNFLDRCYKRKYTSKKLNIKELLEKLIIRITRLCKLLYTTKYILIILRSSQ